MKPLESSLGLQSLALGLQSVGYFIAGCIAIGKSKNDGSTLAVLGSFGIIAGLLFFWSAWEIQRALQATALPAISSAATTSAAAPTPPSTEEELSGFKTAYRNTQGHALQQLMATFFLLGGTFMALAHLTRGNGGLKALGTLGLLFTLIANFFGCVHVNGVVQHAQSKLTQRPIITWFKIPLISYGVSGGGAFMNLITLFNYTTGVRAVTGMVDFAAMIVLLSAAMHYGFYFRALRNSGAHQALVTPSTVPTRY